MQQEASSIAFADCMDRSEVGTRVGPDMQRGHQISLNGDQGATVYLDFFASELCLRGNAPVAQPHMHEGNVLCWNGEVRNC